MITTLTNLTLTTLTTTTLTATTLTTLTTLTALETTISSDRKRKRCSPGPGGPCPVKRVRSMLRSGG